MNECGKERRKEGMCEWGHWMQMIDDIVGHVTKCDSKGGITGKVKEDGKIEVHVSVEKRVEMKQFTSSSSLCVMQHVFQDCVWTPVFSMAILLLNTRKPIIEGG